MTVINRKTELDSPLALSALLHETPYQSYSYSYPHKSAYANLEQAVELTEAWKDEDQSALFSYIHIPFCEFRCGFCNLFTISAPPSDLQQRYVDTLINQIKTTRESLPVAKFARFAMGGGTPSYLSRDQLEQILLAVQDSLNIDLSSIPACVEISPDTINRDKLTVLKAFHVDRISMGVQSFVENETLSLCRPQNNQHVFAAIELLRKLEFPIINLDLIYGIDGQSIDSWMHSVRTAAALNVEELYLYPLYVRPLTGLHKIGLKFAPSHPSTDDLRPSMYVAARDYLLDKGYQQISMRMFRAPHVNNPEGPIYSCQNDGMLGLGSGARSYTKRLHYSGRYSVTRKSSRSIVNEYCENIASNFRRIEYGFILNGEEQRRRYVIQSLLLVEGLDKKAYLHRFGTSPTQDLPQLQQLLKLGLAKEERQLFCLTNEGIARSDSIGPWLASSNVQQRMRQFELK